MIISSKVSDNKYFWVKIPRTATHSYEQLFFPERDIVNNFYPHYHTPYKQPKEMCVDPVKTKQGFTLTRHPLDRFISGINLIYSIWSDEYNVILEQTRQATKVINVCEYCGRENTEIINENEPNRFKLPLSPSFLSSESEFYDFVYDNFGKNCLPKGNLSMDDIFGEQSKYITPFFTTQTYYAYYPQVKIFRYENLSEFNTWIETELGYSTSLLQKLNVSKTKQTTIDTTTQKFKELTNYLFFDDFKCFDYESCV